MKPRTNIQKRIFALSKSISEISETQKEYAYKHCFEHIGRRTAKGVITCSECGHEWIGDGYLVDTLCECSCTNCNTILDVITTKKYVFRQTEYFSVITTCKEFQVIRFFIVKAVYRIGHMAQYSIFEAVQRWISPNGKYETMARLRGMSFIYCDLWIENSPMEIRKDNAVYDINPICVYPRRRVIPNIKRNGFDGDFHKIAPFDLFRNLLSNSKIETLIKTKQYDLLHYFIQYSSKKIDSYWSAVKIAIRNEYKITDCSMWCDYIDLLSYFDKDINNPHYACPVDLKSSHDILVRKKNDHLEKERLEEQRRKIEESEKEFKQSKSKFFGIEFTDGEIKIRTLDSVNEFWQEGTALHHCVFSNAYYQKEDSLILSATVNGVRIETVEVSLTSFNVIQSRGLCNGNTEYHDRIVKLVNENRNLIRRCLVA